MATSCSSPAKSTAPAWEAVDGRVLIYVHKEEELEDVWRRDTPPIATMIMIDDKLRILDAMKRVWGSRLTTVFPRQGHYALDPKILQRYPAADMTVDRIGALVDVDFGA